MDQRRSFLGDTSTNATDASFSFNGGIRSQFDSREVSSLRGDDKRKHSERRSLNIQKSLQILDDSVSSPSLRSRTGGLRRASYAPKSLTPSSKYDTSVQFTPSRTQQFSQNESQIGRHMASSTMYGQSMLTNMGEEFTEEITTTNVALLLDEDPGISACRGMYRDFLQCMKDRPSETQVFDLLSDYERVCQEQVVYMYKLVNRAASRSEPKYQKTFNMLHMLEMEKHTWQLINVLFHDRLEKELQDMQMAVDDINPLTSMKQSEQQAVTKLFDKDSTIRESQLVIDWLEKCAHDVMDNYGDNVKFFSDRAVAWENTLHKLKKSGGVTFGNERPLVTEMDPDAPFRQKKMLDDLDQEDEGRLLQYLFICLRAGQIEKAQEVCKSHGQAWRAATLEGWRLYHDPNFEGPNGQIDPVVGNPYRVVWKSMCWAMAADTKYDVYEKSLYGALSGNLRAMLPVCKSWSDHVWAHYKVLVDIRAETEIRTMCAVDKSLDIPQEYWDQLSDPESIFNRIEANENVQRESQDFYHVIQKWVILGDVEKLLDVMAQWIRGQENTLPQHLIRFMAHVVLFLRSTQHRVNEDKCNVVLEAYVKYLIEEDHKELVSFYVSKLPPAAQVHWYACSYAHALTPYPAEITQSQKQQVLYNGNVYFFSPYPTKSQTTTVTTTNTAIESYSKSPKPVSQTDRTITYGPYEQREAFAEAELRVHYENNSPFLTVTNLERIIEVSHWGNIAVEEHISMRHTGALLKGPFSRYDYQRTQDGLSSIKSFKTVLPAAARDVYYRDEIGNISTSNLKEMDDFVELELRPRFPLFGGWKTQYYIGYNVPSYQYLFNKGDNYALKMRFVDHIFDDMVVDQVTVKIILPEGAKNMRLETPYPVQQGENQLHFTYLDTTGRPVIVIHKSNLVEQHIQDFQLHYTFQKLLLLQEPLIVVGAFYLLFLAVIVYVRLDFSITKDEAKESKMRVASLVEEVQSAHDRRSALYQSYDDAINKYKSTKDANTFAATRKKVDADYKSLTQQISDLQTKLKNEGSDLADKVNELQVSDRQYKDLVALAITLAEKLVSGKINKQQYLDNEKINKTKREDLDSKMEALRSSLA